MNENQWLSLRDFYREEFSCQGQQQGTCSCGGLADMNGDFMGRLQSLRNQYGKPMEVTSGYRCPDHNDAVSNTGRDGPHTTGLAVDIAVDRGNAYRVLQLALMMGFKGIGFKQKGGNRFLHIDDIKGDNRPTIWSY